MTDSGDGGVQKWWITEMAKREAAKATGDRLSFAANHAHRNEWYAQKTCQCAETSRTTPPEPSPQGHPDWIVANDSRGAGAALRQNQYGLRWHMRRTTERARGEDQIRSPAQ
jgi:hypothetical protein